MEKLDQLLKKLHTLTMGNEDKTALKNDIAFLEDKINTFVGTKSEVLANELKVQDQIKKLKKQWQDNKNKEASDLWDQCQKMVEEEENVSNNPKKDKAWSMAYENGHSAGYHEVVNYFRSYCELIRG